MMTRDERFHRAASAMLACGTAERLKTLDFVVRTPGCKTRAVADAAGATEEHSAVALRSMWRAGLVTQKRDDLGHGWEWTATEAARDVFRMVEHLPEPDEGRVRIGGGE